MLEIPITNTLYKFPSLLQIKDTKKNLIKKNISICLENSKNLHFQASKSMVQLLSLKLCKDPFECIGEEDLNIFDDKSIALYIEIDGQIVFNFSESSIEQSDQGCHVIFQKRFFMRYYVYFLRDFTENNEKLYISFKKIRTSDFEGIGIMISILLVLIILAAITFAGYIFYKCFVNSKSARYIPDEEEEGYHSIND